MMELLLNFNYCNQQNEYYPMQQFKLLPINNILESAYNKHIYNPKHIKYKSLYSPTRDKVKDKNKSEGIVVINNITNINKHIKNNIIIVLIV